MIKKGYLLLCMVFFSTLVHANVTLQQEYKEALDAYVKKDFSKSYDNFSKLYLSKLSDKKLNFYLGRSAYETGHYEMALAAFERVEMLDPGNLRNRLEMARTYFMLKMYENAESAFKEVLQNPNIPANVRRNIELYLSKVTKVQEKSFTYATINLDWVYDSNVNYGSLDSEYNINTGTLPATQKISDNALQLYGDVTNVYDIGDKNGYAVKNRVIAYMKKYAQESAYNVSYISYTPSILYSQTASLIELAISLDNLFLADKNYLQSFSVIPRYEFSHTTTLRSIAYFKYQRKYFQQENAKNLDSNHYELSYALQKILSPRSYIEGKIIGTNEGKVQGSRVDVDYMEYRADISYANQFTPTYAANIFTEYRKRDYSDYSTLFASTRADNAGTAAVDLNAKVLPSVRLHLKGMYTRVESNQKRYAYEKYTVTFGLNKIF